MFSKKVAHRKCENKKNELVVERGARIFREFNIKMQVNVWAFTNKNDFGNVSKINE